MFIELHILQNFAPSNLNRDESNSPKDCTFGGVRRARISSQCIKRAIRLHPAFFKATGVEQATRTRYLASAVSSLLQKEGKPKEEADKAAINLVEAILGGMDKKKSTQSNVLFFASKDEKEHLAKAILENWDDILRSDTKNDVINTTVKGFQKAFEKRTSAPDIALFGRMLAADPKLNFNMDAACQVAHAISTHRANMEFDFFTAVDDLQPDDESGAGMMGMVGFNAATFYRYASIDMDQLVKNLDGNRSLAKNTVRGFLEASALAIPTGKQNSFAAQNPPSFLMAVVRKNGGTWSMANAFERPVTVFGEIGLVDASIAAFDQYWGEVQSVFVDQATPIAVMIGATQKPKNLGAHLVPNLKTLIEEVLAEIDKE